MSENTSETFSNLTDSFTILKKINYINYLENN